MRYRMHKSIKSMEIPPQELRKIQMIILEIMIEFDRICRKHGIKYSIDGGTFLGAIRHKGFIPWDPDADIVIMREDYNRFFELCKTELDKSRFFLQDYTTDEAYRWGYARLLRKDTKYIRAGHEHMTAQNGIFMDIFTMDQVPDNVILRKVHRFACFCIRKVLWSEVGRVVHPNVLLRMWFRLLSRIPRDTVFRFRDFVARNNNENDETVLVRHMCSPHPKKYPYGFPKSLFRHLVDYEFEGYKFLGFEEYDWYLKSIYGDYMTPPPISERRSHIPCSSYKLTKPVFAKED